MATRIAGTHQIHRDPERERKRKKQRYMVASIFLSLILLIFVITRPPKGGPEYAICRAFVEQYVTYPTTINITTVENFDRALRIYLTTKDPFGNTRSNMFECILRPDPNTRLAMDRINIDRKAFTDQRRLDLFNKSIPAILKSKTDLTLPKRYSGTLMDLKRD